MLELKNISKTFHPGTVNEKRALHELSLSVPDGDFITIIGANGAGKSTLFGAISGSFLTDSGKILLDGQDVTFLPEHRRSKVIGRLFQDPMRGTAPGMTSEENLALAAGRSGARRLHAAEFRGLNGDLSVFLAKYLLETHLNLVGRIVEYKGSLNLKRCTRLNGLKLVVGG